MIVTINNTRNINAFRLAENIVKSLKEEGVVITEHRASRVGFQIRFTGHFLRGLATGGIEYLHFIQQGSIVLKPNSDRIRISLSFLYMMIYAAVLSVLCLFITIASPSGSLESAGGLLYFAALIPIAIFSVVYGYASLAIYSLVSNLANTQ